MCLAGNASPSVIRSTSYCLPCEAQVGLLSRLPLGALITPLGGLNAGEVHEVFPFFKNLFSPFCPFPPYYILLYSIVVFCFILFTLPIYYRIISVWDFLIIMRRISLGNFPTILCSSAGTSSPLQGLGACGWLRLLWGLHVPPHELAGLWAKVLLPLLWETQRG